MSTMTAIIPSPLDLSAVPTRKIGELLIDVNTATVYMICMDASGKQKIALPIKGEANYRLLQYLKYNNVIGPTPPQHPEHATNWYNTDIVYSNADPNDKKAAYISVKVEDPNAQDGYRWKKILPITESQYVYLGAVKEDGSGVTLYDLLDDTLSRLPVKPITADPADKTKIPSYGEIFIVEAAGTSILKFKKKNGDIITLADTMADTTRTLLEDTITLSKEQPKNQHPNSIWYQYNNTSAVDDALMNAMQLQMHVVDKERYLTAGLKFVSNGNKQTGITILNYNKGVAFEHRFLTGNHTFIPTNVADLDNGFPKDTTVYMEFNIDRDDLNRLGFMFISKDFIIPTDGKMFGETEGSLIFKPDTYTMNAKNVVYDTTNNHWDNTFKGKTIFFMVHKGGTDAAEIAFGYITEEEELNTADPMLSGRKRKLQFIVGSDDYAARTNWVKMPNCYNIVVTALPTGQDGVLSRVFINRTRMTELPEEVKPINNFMPGENIYNKVVLQSNAKSVYLDPTTTLGDLTVGGRLITTIRSYAQAGFGAKARAGELLVEEGTTDDGRKTFQLRYTLEDKQTVPVVGKYEREFLNHLQNSVRWNKSLNAEGITVDKEDPSIVYYLDDFLKNTQSGKYLNVNPSIAVDEGNTGLKRYRFTVPSTFTNFVYHYPKNRRPDEAPLMLESYLQKEYDRTQTLYDKRMYYVDLDDMGIDQAKLNQWQDSGFERPQVLESMVAMMKKNSMLRMNINGKDKVIDWATVSDFERMYKAEYSGELTVIKGSDGDHPTLYLKTKTPDNRLYISVLEWKEDPDTHTWRYIESQHKEISTKRIDPVTKKTYDEVNFLTVHDQAVINDVRVVRKITAPSYTIIGEPKKGEFRGLQVKDVPLVNGKRTVNLISYTGSTNGGPGFKPTINIGGPEFDAVHITSKVQPSWKDPSENGILHKMIIDDDLKGFFRFVKKLDDGALTSLDLDTLNQTPDAGYYTYGHTPDKDLSGKHYPKEVMDPGTFVLFVLADHKTVNGTLFSDVVVSQVLYHYTYDDAKQISDMHIYYRSLLPNGTYGKWSIIPSQADLDKKLDKAGGVITGDLDIKGTTTANILKVLNNLNFPNEVNINKDGKDILKTTTETNGTENKYHIVFGNKGLIDDIKIYNKQGSDRVFVNDKAIALKESVDDLRNRLVSDFATKKELVDMGELKVDKTYLSELITHYMLRDATDPKVVEDHKVTGDIIFGANSGARLNNVGTTKPNFTITNMDILYPNFNTNVEGDTSTKKIPDLGRGIRFDMMGPTSVFTVTGSTNGTSDQISSFQIKAKKRSDSNKSYYNIRSIYGGAVRSDWSQLLTRDDLFDGFNSTSNTLVLTANRGKELYDGMITKWDQPTPPSTDAYTNVWNMRTGQHLVSDREKYDLAKLGFKDKGNYVITTFNDWGNLTGVPTKMVMAVDEEGRLATGISTRDKLIWNPMMPRSEAYTKQEINQRVDSLQNQLDAYTKSKEFATNDETHSIGLNKLAYICYIDKPDNKKAVKFTTKKLPANTDGILIISIKGAMGYAETVDIQINFNISNNGKKYASFVSNKAPGSTFQVSNVTFANGIASFVLTDISNRDTWGTGFNILTQLFGKEFARNDIGFDCEFIDRGSLPTPPSPTPGEGGTSLVAPTSDEGMLKALVTDSNAFKQKVLTDEVYRNKLMTNTRTLAKMKELSSEYTGTDKPYWLRGKYIIVEWSNNSGMTSDNTIYVDESHATMANAFDLNDAWKLFLKDKKIARQAKVEGANASIRVYPLSDLIEKDGQDISIKNLGPFDDDTMNKLEKLGLKLPSNKIKVENADKVSSDEFEKLFKDLLNANSQNNDMVDYLNKHKDDIFRFINSDKGSTFRNKLTIKDNTKYNNPIQRRLDAGETLESISKDQKALDYMWEHRKRLEPHTPGKSSDKDTINGRFILLEANENNFIYQENVYEDGTRLKDPSEVIGNLGAKFAWYKKYPKVIKTLKTDYNKDDYMYYFNLDEAITQSLGKPNNDISDKALEEVISTISNKYVFPYYNKVKAYYRDTLTFTEIKSAIDALKDANKDDSSKVSYIKDNEGKIALYIHNNAAKSNAFNSQLFDYSNATHTIGPNEFDLKYMPYIAQLILANKVRVDDDSTISEHDYDRILKAISDESIGYDVNKYIWDYIYMTNHASKFKEYLVNNPDLRWNYYDRYVINGKDGLYPWYETYKQAGKSDIPSYNDSTINHDAIINKEELDGYARAVDIYRNNPDYIQSGIETQNIFEQTALLAKRISNTSNNYICNNYDIHDKEVTELITKINDKRQSLPSTADHDLGTLTTALQGLNIIRGLLMQCVYSPDIYNKITGKDFISTPLSSTDKNTLKMYLSSTSDHNSDDEEYRNNVAKFVKLRRSLTQNIVRNIVTKGKNSYLTDYNVERVSICHLEDYVITHLGKYYTFLEGIDDGVLDPSKVSDTELYNLMVSKDKNDIKKFTDIVKTRSTDQMRRFINNNQNVHDYVYNHMKSYSLKGLKSINGPCLVLAFGGLVDDRPQD